MPAQYYHDHLKEDLFREIQWTIANKVRDPRVPSVVTITDLNLSNDSRNATVHISIYGDERIKQDALTALNKAAPFIQKLVSQKVRTRHFPRLLFKRDDSIERSLHIGELLKEVNDDLV